MIRAKKEIPLASKVLALGLLVATLMMALGLMLDTKPALADATFTVTRTDDSKDPDLGDGQCGFFSARGGRACSLRAAIEQANATTGVDTIRFNIPGTGVRTISPASALPRITGPVVIDGYTQPGTQKNTQQTGSTNAILLVELNGSNAESSFAGLSITASNVVVRGLVINQFGQGIAIGAGTGTRVEGNFIGTDAGGTLDRGNAVGSGVSIDDFENDDQSGGRQVIVGGTTPDKRNLISGQDFGAGVSIREEGGNKVQGNLIGTQRDGTASLFNAAEGVDIASSRNNVVGGLVAGARNIIAFNSDEGVRVLGNGTSATGNRILGNSIFSNGGLGIDLGANGRTSNDPKDPDTGANTLQNFPVLSSAKTSATNVTTITGQLDSTPGKSFTIQFFSSLRGEDEGKTFVGQKSVTTDAEGKASFTFQPSQTLLGVESVTATATNGGGNTSEFSDPVGVDKEPVQG